MPDEMNKTPMRALKDTLNDASFLYQTITKTLETAENVDSSEFPTSYRASLLPVYTWDGEGEGEGLQKW